MYFIYFCTIKCDLLTSCLQHELCHLKSDIHVQHLHNSDAQHEICRRILKHVLKHYDSHSHNQNVRMTNCIR